MTVNGEHAADGQVAVSAPLLFSTNDCLGAPVSLDYYDRAPVPLQPPHL
jgi:arylsulfatase